jgi:chemotaxis methyl-accepting protein methylase
MDDQQFKQLLDHFQYSWAGYRKVRKGVKKRISRHMQQVRCAGMSEYLELLETHAQEREECERRMAVSISRIFRDRKLWRDLENEILPGLIQAQNEKMKVWSAGCARGEEVYSFMIVWDRLRVRFNRLPKLEMIATDMHPEYIEKAKTGIYAKSSLKEVADEIRADYFDKKKGGNRYDIIPLLKNNITWQIRNMFSDTPGYGFHIIFLRNNLLTYYQNDLIKAPFTKIIDSLNPDGWLIIGSHEKLPDESSGLTRNPSTPWAYRKDIQVNSQLQK